MKPVPADSTKEEKQTTENISSRGGLTEPQPNAKEVTWDSLPNTDQDVAEGDKEKSPENGDNQHAASSVAIKRVEKRKMSPMKNEESPDNARAARKKKQ